MKIGKRLLLILFTVLFSTTITFFVIRLMPGDPVETMAVNIHAGMGVSWEEAVEQAKARLNYDPDIPLAKQYISYLGQIVRGDLGDSILRRAPVSEIIAEVLPWTLLVSSVALLISFLLGTLLGVYCGWKRKSLLNKLMTAYDSVIGSVPAFIIGFLLIILFSVKLGWLPMRGNYDTDLTPGWNSAFIASVAKHAVLPILTWVLTSVGGWALGMRALAVSVLGEDYIISAKARGLRQRRIVGSYVGRNAILPQITQLAITFGSMFAGSVLVENTFNYPGMGYFFSSAISGRDYPLMQGMFLVLTIAIVLANQAAEILYSVIDPRIRIRGK